MNFESGSVPTVRRLMSFWLVVAVFVGTFTVAAPQFDNAAIAVAQDGDADAAPETPPAEGDKTKEKKEAKSALGWLIEALGIYLLVFLLISVALVSLMIMNFLAVRRSVVCPAELIDGFQAHLDEKQYQEAYELAKADESFLGNVLSAGLSKVSTSYKHAVAAMQLSLIHI